MALPVVGGVNVGSLFSGIGGMDYGLHQAGFRHDFFCEGGGDPDGSDAEREQFKQGEYRRSVLRTRFPGVPVYDDIRTLGKPAGGAATDGDSASVDLGWWEAGTGLLCGGFPCQDLSIAGRRAGLDGERSVLFFEFARIIDLVRPGWVLIENVPGLLSSNGGRDFGVVLGTLADLGYGVAWRVLNARFFGVPQRRRRVFILGAIADGDPRSAAERASQVLAVGSRCPGHPATREEARADVAVASLSGLGNGGPDDNDGQANRIVSHALTSEGADASEDGTGRGTPLVAAPLTKGSATGEGVNPPGRRQEDDVNIVAYPLARRGRDGGSELEVGEPGVYNALRAGDGGSSRINQVMVGTGVRRLTPTECERLQGLPDGWTRLDAKTPDSRRYSALGDAVTANVTQWIGERIKAAAA